MRVTTDIFKKFMNRVIHKLDCLELSSELNSTPTENRQVEIIDTASWTSPADTKNYFYTVVSGTAEVNIGSETISGIPQGFEGSHGTTNSATLVNPVTITGEANGTRIIIYYEI